MVEQLLEGHQRSVTSSTADVDDLLDKLDYCNVDRLRHYLDNHDHSATPNTVIYQLCSYPCRLCRSAWVGRLVPSVCLSVCP